MGQKCGLVDEIGVGVGAGTAFWNSWGKGRVVISRERSGEVTVAYVGRQGAKL